jgi:hypothetical protein
LAAFKSFAASDLGFGEQDSPAVSHSSLDTEETDALAVTLDLNGNFRLATRPMTSSTVLWRAYLIRMAHLSKESRAGSRIERHYSFKR